MAPDQVPHHDDELEAAAEAAMGGELLASLDPLLMVESLSQAVTFGSAMKAAVNLTMNIPAIALGLQDAELPARDSRFKDPTFSENVFFRRLAASYVLWEKELMAAVENKDVDWRTQERARMLMSAMTTAFSPTNHLVGNPEALKLAFTTGGGSLRQGFANFISDVVANRGYPSQVDKSAFEVGKNVATTPGWVVYRTPMFELIHYTPTIPTVGKRPLVLLPPPVNKYYFWDLAPGRSLIEYVVDRGVDCFTIVWRDPREDNGDWGVEAYLTAAYEAVDVVLEITGADGVQVFGDCSGGMLLSMLLAHQAAEGTNRITSGTLGVTVLDFGEPGGIGVTASDRGLSSVQERADRKEVISADDISSTFVWMRPNDLVWRYLIDEWLLGRPAPAFDIMFWNADGQGMPAQFAYDMTKMSLGNSLLKPGGMNVLGADLDLSAIDVPTYHIAGLTDHISPWKGCYAGARVMGGDKTFVLTPTGHVQSIIYPMGKPRAAFWTGPDLEYTPESWQEKAERTDDSWWEHWVDWILANADGERPAAPGAGSAKYTPIIPAPGRYVLGD